MCLPVRSHHERGSLILRKEGGNLVLHMVLDWRERKLPMVYNIASGAVIAAAAGVAVGNTPLGVIIGAALGAALGAFFWAASNKWFKR